MSVEVEMESLRNKLTNSEEMNKLYKMKVKECKEQLMKLQTDLNSKIVTHNEEKTELISLLEEQKEIIEELMIKESHKLKKLRRRLEEQNSLAQTKYEEKSEELDNCTMMLASKDATIDELRLLVQDQKMEIEKEVRARQDMETEIDGRKKELDIKCNEIEKLEDLIKNYEAQLEESKTEIEELKITEKSLSDDKSELEHNFKDLKVEVDVQSNEIKKLEDVITDYESQLEESKTEIEKLIITEKSLSDEKSKLEQVIEDLQIEVEKKNAIHEELILNYEEKENVMRGQLEEAAKLTFGYELELNQKAKDLSICHEEMYALHLTVERQKSELEEQVEESELLKQTKEIIQQEKNQAISENAKLISANRDLLATNGKLQEIVASYEEKVENLGQEISAIQLICEEKIQDNEIMNKKVDELQEKLDMITTEMAAIQQKKSKGCFSIFKRKRQ